MTNLNNDPFHQRNAQHYSQVLRRDINQEIDNTYDVLAFAEQLAFIQSRFYTVTGSGREPVYKMRQREERLDPIKIQKSAIYDTISRRFKEQLQPLFLSLWDSGDILKFIPSCATERYEPQNANNYIPPIYKQKEARLEAPKMFKEYMNRIVPPEELCWYITDEENKFPQQRYLTQWLAQRLQKPEEAPHVAIIMRGEQGTGKSFLCDVLMKPLVGETNYKAVALADAKANFRARLFQSTLIQIEEINDTRSKTTEKLKPLVTQDYYEVDEKFVPKYSAKKMFGIVMTSNFKNPITIEETDRRYFIPTFSKVLPKNNQFYEDFAEWLEHEGGHQEMCDYLHSIDISALNFRKPPMTNDKKELMVLETSAESKQDMCVLFLTQNKEYHFKADTLSTLYKITVTDAQQALREANYSTIEYRPRIDGKLVRLWKHLDNKDGKKELKVYQAHSGENLYMKQPSLEDGFIEVEGVERCE